jgi:hypothetical protein
MPVPKLGEIAYPRGMTGKRVLSPDLVLPNWAEHLFRPVTRRRLSRSSMHRPAAVRGPD